MLKEGECLENDIIQGTIPGTQRPGRPRTPLISNITSWTRREWVNYSVRLKKQPPTKISLFSE